MIDTGDPRSIDLCHRLGLDYVSCSPFRIPVARLAAAHATLAHGKRASHRPAGHARRARHDLRPLRDQE
jgi:pyruvate,orthophosphate dikinase